MPASNVSQPYFGRAWSLSIATQKSGTFTVRSLVADGESPLRMTFAVDTYALMVYWTAQIMIYGLSADTSGAITAGAPNYGDMLTLNQPLAMGDTVNLSAGYESAASGSFDSQANLIYTGRIIQAVVTRENVVDYKLILRCAVGLMEDMFNLVSLPIPANTSALEAIQQVCSQPQANLPKVDIDAVAQQKLSQAKLPRGSAIHGKPYEVIQKLVKQCGLFSWISPNGLNIRSFDPSLPLPQPSCIYAPPNLPGTSQAGATNAPIKSTLLGVPEQTQNGIVFRVLLDSSVKVGDAVQLAPGTFLSPYAMTVPGLPVVPSRNGTYIVNGVRHVGDSRGRGDDWYTQVTGVTPNFFPSFLLGTQPQSQKHG